MTTTAMTSHGRSEAWLMAAAIGFAALMLLGAMLDARGPARSGEGPSASAPLTNEELVREMLTHD